MELIGVEPAIWRDFEIANDVHLDELHEIVQIVMGWTNSHLHRFAIGDDWHEPDTAEFVTEFDAEEGDEGVLETEVRLDEVLHDVGDRLLYLYDFGDNWRHTITLQSQRALSSGDEHEPRCLAGAWACPPEDCGGVFGYEELRGDLDRVLRGETVGEWQWLRLHWLAGDQAWEQVKAGLETCDVDQVNTSLDRRTRWRRLSGELGGVIRRAPAAPYIPEVVEVIERIPPDPPEEVDADLAKAMTDPFVWMIRRIGDGLKLTDAGKLRPDDVVAVAEKLGLADEWIGAMNRESNTPQVTEFRMAMRDLGLARQAKGWLLPTKLARTLIEDPVRLWWHIAGRLPLGDGPERDEALAGLVLTAAGVDQKDEASGRVFEELMTDFGWRYEGRSPLRLVDRAWGYSRTKVVLLRAGGFLQGVGRLTGPPTEGGILLARAALTSPPLW